MKLLYLSFKEELIKKIREKALVENASYVLMLTKEKHEGKETKIVFSWKIIWLGKPVPNVFLYGIFDKTSVT